MAKTLIIKDADYSNNALTQVLFDTVPCTGITLDKETLSIVTTGNTASLTATKSPADTTDAVTWSTSDSNVATVSNGTVTAVGIGTATITVSCGEYSDTCAITVTEFMDKDILKKMCPAYITDANKISGGGNGITGISTTSTYANRGSLAASSGEKYVNDFNGDHFYAYPLPKNTARIKITDTGSTGIKTQTIYWYNSQTSSTASGYENMCGVLGDTVLSSESSTTYITTIPTYQDLPAPDSVVIMFRTYKTGTTFADSDFADVTIEFLTAET